MTQQVHIKCGACGHETDVSTSAGYACPGCGAIEGLIVNVSLEDTAQGYDFIGIKGRDETGRVYLDVKSGDNYFRKDEEWHEIEQVVDKRERRYRKKVVRKLTGEVLRDEDGPLEKHEPTAVKRRRKQEGG